MSFETVPHIRIRVAKDLPLRTDGDWVLYWMTAFRRTGSNFALQHARDLAKKLNKPLVILEALRVRYRWASDRLHRFVIDGMIDNRAATANTDVLYYPYVESKPGEGSGLVGELAQRACAVVSDDYPCFFHPSMIAVVSRKIVCRFELVDSNCLMPLSIAGRTFTVAHSYRRHMQKVLPIHLDCMPDLRPLDKRSTRGLPKLLKLPNTIAKRWPAADLEKLTSEGGLTAIPIDHSVLPTTMHGGSKAADKLLLQFLNRRLASYNHDRNEPDSDGSSELSPYLHFGHISPHEVFQKLMEKVGWHPGMLHKPNGKVNGFWGVREDAEAFLDQLCTWREIGFNMCWREPNFDRFESLPVWAQQTMNEHAADPREHVYSLEQLDAAGTYDSIWNAAQRQLVREGRIHNYLRMLWGKKIYQWSSTPQAALEAMIELNNKYALDGRDPNSYSGIFWVLGRYDRAWGPERPVFGKLRYMTSANTAKKHALTEYLKRYAKSEDPRGSVSPRR